MNLLIVSATEFETAPLAKQLNFIAFEGDNMRKCSFENHKIDFLIAGVGIPFTIFSLTKILFDNKYDLIINAGIAGSFKEDIALGAVVNVIQEQFADIGIEEKGKFTSIFEISLHDKNHFPFSEGRLINNTDIRHKIIQQLRTTTGVTVNTVSGSNETIKFIKDCYKPDVETMEGAAFFYVCMMEKIPFVQIRSISNFVEERDTSKWKIKTAVEQLNATLLEILKSF